ncbi:MAG: DMT family transporter [Planctomycetales bacterium]|nr:DMT family transporter [Planctomycetales bacterium]
MSYLYFLTICLLFGSNFYLMKLASSAYGPSAIGAGRLLGGGAVLALIWRLTTPEQRAPRKLWLTIFGIALFSQAYPYALQPLLISHGVEHSLIGMMVSFTPLAILLVSIPVLGVWPTVRQLVGVGGGLACLLVLCGDGLERGHSLLVMAAMVSVPLSYGFANAYLKKLLSDAAPLPVATLMLLVGGVLLAPIAVGPPAAALGLAAPEHPEHWTRATLALLYLGPIGTGLASWLWVKLVSAHGPLFAGMVTYVVPVIALFWGAFDGERITPQQLGAIAGVLSMVALVQYGAGRKPSAPAAVAAQKPCEKPEELACGAASR